MRNGCSRVKWLPTLSALALGVAAALAPVATAASSSSASRIAERVAAATDQQLIIVMRQQMTPTYAAVTYSDEAKRISAEYLGRQLYSGDIKGSWYLRTPKHCYRTSQERFVGLSTIGVSLLPQSAATVTAIAYTQLGAHELRWSIGATGAHGLEQGTVWYNSRGLIVKAQDRSYKTGRHGTAQTTTITLSYPKKLPETVPAKPPAPACKA